MSATFSDDPRLWLEEIDSERALSWVRERNGESEGELSARPQYGPMRVRLKTILDSKERIPYVSRHGDYFYNFWRDAGHERGIWRRTTLDEYRKAEPQWETVLDLDRLAREEGENWVWTGARSLKPRGARSLVSLSRGGGDAHVVREFDLETKEFVTGGFSLPEAKTSIAWIDEDTLFVATDFGPGSMTSSGYPRIVKEWRRGTPLSEAALVYEALPDDLSASAYRDHTPGHEHQFVHRQVGFYSSELFLREGGRLTRVPKPDDANAFTVRDQIVIELRSDWTVAGRTYPQGALLATGFAAFMAGGSDFELLFAPTPSTSLDGLTATRSAILLTILDNVKNRVVELRPEVGDTGGRWQSREIDAPAMGALDVFAVDEVESDQYFLTVTDFLTPTSLYLVDSGSDRREPL